MPVPVGPAAESPAAEGLADEVVHLVFPPLSIWGSFPPPTAPIGDHALPAAPSPSLPR